MSFRFLNILEFISIISQPRFSFRNGLLTYSHTYIYIYRVSATFSKKKPSVEDSTSILTFPFAEFHFSCSDCALPEIWAWNSGEWNLYMKPKTIHKNLRTINLNSNFYKTH